MRGGKGGRMEEAKIWEKWTQAAVDKNRDQINKIWKNVKCKENNYVPH